MNDMAWANGPFPEDDEEPTEGEFLAACKSASELRRLPYATYLDSAHWQALRRRMMLRSGGMCSRCYAEGGVLDVHHLTYARLGCEHEADLAVLCRTCHEAEHGGAFF